MLQLLIALFGLTSIWLAMGNNVKGRRWAPIIGLIGQPFWFIFAIQSDAWGLLILTSAYTIAYIRGIYVQWRKLGDEK